MNRTRLTYEVNLIRKKVVSLLTDSLGEWYDIQFSATADHVADRLKDRSQSIKKDLAMVEEILSSMANHYSCNLLYFVHNDYDIQRIVLHRKVDGKTFAVPITAKRYPAAVPGGKELIKVTVRTVIPEYEEKIPVKNIKIDYKYPKITFEYDGFRRVLSRLTRLIQSDSCPAALRMLRTK